MFNSDEEQFVVGQGKSNRRSLTFKEKGFFFLIIKIF